ncbi:group II intron reverse transcriptase/maturase [Leptolyngbya sp. 7M]|uniref:group II intron reverse transcriptase/maturase n=1 Tax=Leptolyngbya sp. 7M TaxID=2812896 RepID=UPI001B8B30ED|nr:group II intron reverse transcriptase/maturase [Leptolyngbya sp. 7M]QYO62516.1 hypothetical protein JVX88_20875 [Leptolyngbya sp. 7M]
MSQYQAEYRGVVQYYRMAYNLHTLGTLRRLTELPPVKTLANKFKTSCQNATRLAMSEKRLILLRSW